MYKPKSVMVCKNVPWTKIWNHQPKQIGEKYYKVKLAIVHMLNILFSRNMVQFII